MKGCIIIFTVQIPDNNVLGYNTYKACVIDHVEPYITTESIKESINKYCKQRDYPVNKICIENLWLLPE